MADEPNMPPSFTPGRKWRVGIDMLVRTAVVLAVLVMVNYLASRHFHRAYLSAQTRDELSPRTIQLLKSFTNQVKVTLYYSRDDDYYPAISGLLNEFHNINPRIRVTMIDPLHDPGEALKLKQTYELGTATNRNFVIFDCEGGGKQFVLGERLVNFDYQQSLTAEGQLRFNRKAVSFNGEVQFAAALLAATSPKPMVAYFLRGHGEHVMTEGDDPFGYEKFTKVLEQNYVRPVPLLLLSTNQVPADCNLLIIAGAYNSIPDSELQKIEQYLSQGGRLLTFLNPMAGNRQAGFQKVLEKWGVAAANTYVIDMENSPDGKGDTIKVTDFGAKPHPVVRSLVNLSLQLVRPAPVVAIAAKDRPTDAPTVQEIAFAGPHAFLAGDKKEQKYAFPLAVAVERGLVKGVINERGTTRMIVVGDSTFLDNEMIEAAANRDFAHAAINWLLDRQQLLEGLGPRPINEYRISMSAREMQTVRWVLLAAMPGGILLLGGLVWLRRRK